MRLAAVIITLFTLFATSCFAAPVAKPKPSIDLSGFSSVPVNTYAQICATSTKTSINVNNLRWTLRNRYAKMKLLPGMPASCRMYYAPAIPGWDRIKVTYKGNANFGMSIFAITNPTRP
jgi:hypothetical protein